MVLNNSFNNSIAIQEKLVQDIVNLKNEIDTKETNFFFSSLLTGKLYLFDQYYGEVTSRCALLSPGMGGDCYAQQFPRHGGK